MIFEAYLGGALLMEIIDLHLINNQSQKKHQRLQKVHISIWEIHAAKCQCNDSTLYDTERVCR